MRSVSAELSQPFLPLLDGAPALQSTRDSQFGDYQCSAALALAKKAGKKPRDLATEWLPPVAQALEGKATVDIAGPGFLNVKLDNGWLARRLESFDPTVWEHDKPRQRVVVDYSSPNVAKEFHVGHIRSTILGDSIVRVLMLRGHEVIRQNHLGDWGTQFGMLCAHIEETQPSDDVSLQDLYRAANARFTSDPEFQEKARQTVVKLHNGDPATLAAWRRVVDLSRAEFEPLYERLGVLLQPSDQRGESFYNDRLEGVVETLASEFATRKHGLEVRVSDGALCAFLYDDAGEPLFRNQDGEPLPFIMRKKDGAFLYASTDLAACKFRVDELKADRIIVVTDARQALHFKMLIATLERSGWLSPEGRPDVPYEHITFGTILGSDRRPLKTRSGENVLLRELFDEGHARCKAIILENTKRSYAAEEVEEIAEKVSVGAIKYADLSQHRSTDYVFQWDKMLAVTGNTAVYLLYAYARIQSLRENASEAGLSVDPLAPIALDQPEERALGVAILRFPDILEQVEPEWRINLLCDYLYEVSGLYMSFYEHCPILKAPAPPRAVQLSRLRLCDLTARTLKAGLDLLGISVADRM